MNKRSPLNKLSKADREKEMKRLRRHIRKVRAGYTQEQKNENTLLQLHFILEDWYKDWQRGRKDATELKTTKAGDFSPAVPAKKTKLTLSEINKIIQKRNNSRSNRRKTLKSKK